MDEKDLTILKDKYMIDNTYRIYGEFVDFCKSAHANTNHFYDGNLPYVFHLQMVVNEVIAHLPKADDNCFPYILKYDFGSASISRAELIMAAYGHDLIEDARMTYNDVLKASKNTVISDIIYACTNEKGRNRAERANDKYYEGIRNTAGASFIKFCDRIANVKFCKMMGSSQFEMYRKENPKFIDSVYIPEIKQFGLRETLESLFK